MPALDMKFGNLLGEVSPELTTTSEEDIAATLGICQCLTTC